MDIKKALEEAGGDSERAKEMLHQAGLEKAAQKDNRPAAEGLIYSYIHGRGQIGVLLEINCETSFVSKTSELETLAHEIALQIASMGPRNVDELIKQEYIRDTSRTIRELIAEVIAKTGENITVKRFTRYEVGK